MPSQSSSHVRLEVDRGVAVIVLDDAATRNALDGSSARALVDACDAIDADHGVGVAVVRGAHRTFCSGAARGVLAALAAAPTHHAYDGLEGLYRAFTRLGRLQVPSVAVIEGAAVGAGLNLALAADIRVATKDALLVSGFATNGLHPGGGHFHLLARSGGRSAAAALGLFGQRLTGREAQRLGLVWATATASELPDLVGSLTSTPAADPTLARAAKASFALTTGAGSSWGAATEVERARQLWSLTRPRASDSRSAR